MAGKKGAKWNRPVSTSPTHAAAVRERIQVGLITEALAKHTLGQKKMVASQVAAGLGLLRKVMPDLSDNKHEHAGEVNLTVINYGRGKPTP